MQKNQNILKLALGMLWVIGVSAPAYAAECNTSQLDKLFNLMAQRSSLMKGVAAYKYIKKQNPYDAPQEVRVLQGVLNIADTNQLNTDRLMVFSQIQMDQAKQIQQYWLNRWKEHPEEAPDPAITPDISNLRQQIATVDDKLYPAIAANTANLRKCPAEISLQQFNKAYSILKGIPKDPDYNLLLLAALKDVVR